jgi:uncharacterized protein GlcG (DUF336 family)
MKTKHTLESSDLKLIAAAAEAEALKNNWAVSIAIVDDGVAFQPLRWRTRDVCHHGTC